MQVLDYEVHFNEDKPESIPSAVLAWFRPGGSPICIRNTGL